MGRIQKIIGKALYNSGVHKEQRAMVKERKITRETGKTWRERQDGKRQ